MLVVAVATDCEEVWVVTHKKPTKSQPCYIQFLPTLVIMAPLTGCMCLCRPACRFRAVHEEVIKLDHDFGATFSGVLTDGRGRVRALWGSYAEQVCRWSDNMDKGYACRRSRTEPSRVSCPVTCCCLCCVIAACTNQHCHELLNCRRAKVFLVVAPIGCTAGRMLSK